MRRVHLAQPQCPRCQEPPSQQPPSKLIVPLSSKAQTLSSCSLQIAAKTCGSQPMHSLASTGLAANGANCAGRKPNRKELFPMQSVHQYSRNAKTSQSEVAVDINNCKALKQRRCTHNDASSYLQLLNKSFKYHTQLCSSSIEFACTDEKKEKKVYAVRRD